VESISNGCSVTNCYAAGAVSGISGAIGGLVGAVINNNSINDCAGLNPIVTSTSGGYTSFGRVTGDIHAMITFTNNAGFVGIILPAGATGHNGADITTAAIKADGSLGGRFTTANGWTVENGKLPGFGAAVALPEHLKQEAPLNPPKGEKTPSPQGEGWGGASIGAQGCGAFFVVKFQ